VTIKQALGSARETLTANNIEDAPLESELLLRHTLGIGRVQLYLELERELDPVDEAAYRQLIERRLHREPTAYITGRREFYGLDFHVDPNVLIPRPESELLVERALQLARNQAVSTIADIGTGCGAIAINLALALPQCRLYATDISDAALKVALANCQEHAVADRVSLLPGDLLDPLPEPVDLIVANLPYVRRSELRGAGTLDYEPALALDGGSDGLEKIRQLSTQVGHKLRPGGCLLLEIAEGQRRAVTTLLRDRFPSAQIEVTPDLRGIDRVVSLFLPLDS